MDFPIYDTYICKEGIFINLEYNNKNIIFYLDDINQYKINKLFFFKKKKYFEKELKLFIKIGKELYFEIRNIENKESGLYNYFK